MKTVKFSLLNILALLGLSINGTAYAKDLGVEKTATAAFAAFGAGEKTGDYTSFKKFIGGDFSLYSHPVQPIRGVFIGAIARDKIGELIAKREKTPNALTFSNVQHFCKGSSCVFQFDSEGLIAGSFPYKGYNAIALTVAKGKVIGFREYLGDVEPLWFQKK
jgi:hypothetical protein